MSTHMQVICAVFTYSIAVSTYGTVHMLKVSVKHKKYFWRTLAYLFMLSI